MALNRAHTSAVDQQSTSVQSQTHSRETIIPQNWTITHPVIWGMICSPPNPNPNVT